MGVPADTGRATVWMGGSAFDQANITCTRSFRRLLGLELHALSFAQQFEHSAADRAAVKEVLDASFITDEPEPLVDEETCDSPGRHNPVLRRAHGLGQSQAPWTACETARRSMKPRKELRSGRADQKVGPV